MSDHTNNYAPIDLIQKIKERAERTPDFRELRIKTDIPVFVYGTLKRGDYNNRLLEGSKYLGEAETSTRYYNMKSTGGFPVVFKRNELYTGSAKVEGEVYLVNLETLTNLDRLEDNGHMYIRSLNYVFLKDQPFVESDGAKYRPSLQCWMYIGNEDFWRGHELDEIMQTTRGVNSYYIWP